MAILLHFEMSKCSCADGLNSTSREINATDLELLMISKLETDLKASYNPCIYIYDDNGTIWSKWLVRTEMALLFLQILFLIGVGRLLPWNLKNKDKLVKILWRF